MKQYIRELGDVWRFTSMPAIPEIKNLDIDSRLYQDGAYFCGMSYDLAGPEHAAMRRQVTCIWTDRTGKKDLGRGAK